MAQDFSMDCISYLRLIQHVSVISARSRGLTVLCCPFRVLHPVAWSVALAKDLRFARSRTLRRWLRVQSRWVLFGGRCWLRLRRFRFVSDNCRSVTSCVPRCVAMSLLDALGCMLNCVLFCVRLLFVRASIDRTVECSRSTVSVQSPQMSHIRAGCR
jgi:hypothetical protein